MQVYFTPDEVHAAIVTCGGLCPGLNTVIREIVCALYHMYSVTKVLGIDVRPCFSLFFFPIWINDVRNIFSEKKRLNARNSTLIYLQ